MSSIKIKNDIDSELLIEHSSGNGAVSITSEELSKLKTVGTIAELQSITNPPPTVWCSGYYEDNDGAFGSNIFKWNDSSIDEPNGGTVIKLDSVETGRYELQYDGVVEFSWFGPDNTGVEDCYDKLMEAINCTSDSSTTGSIYYPTSNALHLGKGIFKIDSTVEINTRITIYGDDSGLTDEKGSTVLVFPTDTTGFIMRNFQTGSVASMGTCSTLKGFQIKSTYGTNRNAHGVHLEVRTSIIDMSINEFSGAGIYGNSNDLYVNFNLSEIRSTSIFQCHNGIEFLGGDDANACNFYNLNVESPYNWAVYDLAYYSNIYHGCHFGVSGVATGGAVNSTNGHFYTCYAEGNNPCVFGSGALVIGGTLSSQYSNTTGEGIVLKNTSGTGGVGKLECSKLVTSASYENGSSAPSRYVDIGYIAPTGDTNLMFIKSSSTVSYALTDYQNILKFTTKVPSQEGIYNILGVGQTQYMCGRDVAPENALKVPSLFLGDTSYARNIRFGSSLYAVSNVNAAIGDIIFNTNPTPGGHVGWVCTTASVSGAGAVWKTFGTISS